MLEVPLLGPDNIVATSFLAKKDMDVEDELIEAVRAGDIETVEFLLCSEGSGGNPSCADINAQDGEALVTAVYNKDFKMVEYLLSKGADIHASSVTSFSSEGERPLLAAVENGDFKMTEYLLSKGANPSEAVSYYQHEYGGEDDRDVLAMAEDLRTMALLLSYKPYPNLPYSNAYTTALEKGDLDRVKLLNKYGAEPHNHDLVRAADKGRVNVVRYFIEQGLDPSQWYRGTLWSPRNREIVELLTDSFSLPKLEAVNALNLLSLERLRALMPEGALGSLIARYL